MWDLWDGLWEREICKALIALAGVMLGIGLGIGAFVMWLVL